MVIRILIVSSIRLYREGLEQLLSQRAELRVIGTRSEGRDAIPFLKDVPTDVVLLDLATQHSHTTAREIARMTPAIPLVVIGIADSDRDVLHCAELGAIGYVTRDGSLDELVAAVQSAARGELVCSPRRAGTLIRHVAALAGERVVAQARAKLTRREREIAALMQDDLSNKEIAVRLRIEVATVKNHVHSVLEKLNIHRRADAGHAMSGTLSRIT
jgi:two-component system, NarL family, nitrate/nitrite response regulator NarL